MVPAGLILKVNGGNYEAIVFSENTEPDSQPSEFHWTTKRTSNSIFDYLFTRTTHSPSTLVTSTMSTRAYEICMQHCIVTAQFDPVCGSDGNNYYNSRQLVCARDCGRRKFIFGKGI